MTEETRKPGAKAPARDAVESIFSPGVICLGLALGCNLSWVMMAFQSLGIFHDQPDPEAVLDATYLISIVVSIATYLVVAALPKRFRAISGTTAANIVFPVGVAASTVLMFFGTTTTAAGTACIAAGGVLSGIFTSLFMMHFGILFSMM